ncbi:hypothetical protein C942_01443 [Photobacterium marinum]|uniref:Uncharacterized protein n=1 Tax=Photobacterium marinum TaxID=1056511 RepID=L8JJ36_9GAMM|nr:hypothetical protein C942_01443 [Photobacterium marinum]
MKGGCHHVDNENRFMCISLFIKPLVLMLENIRQKTSRGLELFRLVLV